MKPSKLSQKSRSEIRDLYFSKVRPQASELSSMRIVTRRKIITLNVVIASIVGIFLLTHQDLFIGEHMESGIKLLGFILFGSGWLSSKIWSKYVSHYKATIMRPIFESLVKNSKYSPEGKVQGQDIKKSLLVDDYEFLDGHDHVHGIVGHLPAEFSIIHAYSVEGSGKHRREVTKFEGLFFSFTLPKDHDQHTLILEDKLEGFWGKNIARFLQKRNSPVHGMELVQVESVSFEKTFMVYSDDQIKARVLLTPGVLSNLEEFKGRYRYTPHISLSNRRLYLTIPMRKGIFSPRFMNEVVRMEDVALIYDLLKIVTDLQAELELAEREVA